MLPTASGSCELLTDIILSSILVQSLRDTLYKNVGTADIILNNDLSLFHVVMVCELDEHLLHFFRLRLELVEVSS